MRTFQIGGIHPPENKLSAKQPIQTIPPPASVVIPLNQHVGAPALAVVAKGDTVKTGMLIGKANGFISANIHSSVSGTVTKVDQMIDGSGFSRPAIFIATSGDEWEPEIHRDDVELMEECTLTPKEIIDKIEAAGIVGMGGAAFPTKVKLMPPSGSKAEVLIINAAECEPYLTADEELMMRKTAEIIVGIKILMKALSVNRAVIGIENNKPEAIRQMAVYASKYEGIEVVTLKSRYPQGGEKQLIDAIIRRQVKSGALPISVGAIVHNVGTVFAVYEAVQHNKPLIERVVTVTGKSVVKPANLLVRIGTPIADLIEAVGGLPEDTGKIIVGGPMMGKAIINTQAPATKGTSGIVIMTKKESLRRPARDCIRCAKCVGACPMGLTPNQLMNLSEYKLWEDAEKNHITDCIECGSCSYTCPANRPLLDNIRLGKSKVMDIMRNRKQS